MSKIKFPAEIFVPVHENSWMDEKSVEYMCVQSEKFNNLLVWDMFGYHKTNAAKNNAFSDMKQTSLLFWVDLILQPLDVSLNEPFKDALREQWN